MKVKVYGYRGCSTCKKAYAFLGKKGLAFEELDITERAPNKAELKGMLAQTGGNLKKLFNTSGVVYREQRIGEKLTGMSESDAIELLSGNGRLVKRPFLIVNGKPVTVGFDEARWNEALD